MTLRAAECVDRCALDRQLFDCGGDQAATGGARPTHIVGRERVVPGTDCGFGTFVGFGLVEPEVTWLKLAALAEGDRGTPGVRGSPAIRAFLDPHPVIIVQ